MMNLIALGLVVTSLVTAGFFSPSPRSREDDVIVKEGHRVVVVEYEKDDGNTKVLISPQKADGKGFAEDKLEGVKDEMGNIVGDQQEENIHHKFRPRELVCDAYGKCKHKISSALERTKESAAEKASAAVNEAAEKVKDKIEEGKEKVKDSAKTLEKVSAGAKKELREIMRHAGDVFDYVAPPERVGPVVHLMGFAAAYGMCVWITFASSYVLAGALPRQQFAVVQSKIYPVYFKGMACALGMALLGHLVGPSRPPAVALFQGLNLAAALGMIFTNLMWLEPQATKVMLARMKKEKEEGGGKEEASRSLNESAAGRGPSSEESAAKSQIIQFTQTLQRLNSYSSFLNALTLVSLTWHLVHLSQRMHAAAC